VAFEASADERETRGFISITRISPVSRLAGELDVGAAGLDADRTDDRHRGVAELLVRLVGERHLGRHRDRVARVDAHRVEVLDRADDDDVVVEVAYDLELELVPAAYGLLDEHLRDRALAQSALDDRAQLGLGLGEAATVPAEREGRPNDGGRGDLAELVDRGHDLRARRAQAATLDGVAEKRPVLGAPDDVHARADQLDAELLEDPRFGELDREVERGLPAECGQQCVGPLATEHVRDALDVERLDIRAVGEARIGHDRGRVRVMTIVRKPSSRSTFSAWQPE